jgi:heme A synthase
MSQCQQYSSCGLLVAILVIAFWRTAADADHPTAFTVADVARLIVFGIKTAAGIFTAVVTVNAIPATLRARTANHFAAAARLTQLLAVGFQELAEPCPLPFRVVGA